MVRLNKPSSEIGQLRFSSSRKMREIARIFSKAEIKPKLCEYCHKDIRHKGRIIRSNTKYCSIPCERKTGYRRRLKREGKKITQLKKGKQRAGL